MAGRLLQVASTTVTTAVSAIDFSTKITDNNVYQLVFTNLAPTSDSQNLEFRVTKTSDNSADSTSNYDKTGKSLRANETFGDVSVQNDDSFIQVFSEVPKLDSDGNPVLDENGQIIWVEAGKETNGLLHIRVQ